MIFFNSSTNVWNNDTDCKLFSKLTKKIDDAIQEGKDMKADGYVYENYELKKKGGD